MYKLCTGNVWKINTKNQQRRDYEFYYVKSTRLQRIRRLGDILVMLFLQCFVLLLFVGFSKYSPDADASDLHTSTHSVFGGFDPHFNTYRRYNSMFQDVHVMIFIGFGFLMTFLKRYGFSAVGFNFFLAALLVQWAILCSGFFHLRNLKIPISIESLIEADIAVAAVLISMGAVLGQTSLIQLVIMGIIEIVVYSTNSYVGYDVLKVSDAGASIFVHTFGAYFGLAVSYVINRMRRKEGLESENPLEGSTYTSDLFATIGTIFLWLYWPSFNGGELIGDGQHRAIINTYISLAASCVTAFAVSAFMTPDFKFDMVHIQNSTLAGGVAVGASANMMIEPYGAILVGIAAGALSVVGYSIITPWIDRTIGIHDTCGVHNLHGMPGVLAGIVAAIMAAVATEDKYQVGLYDLFPARGPVEPHFHPDAQRFISGDARSALQQAGYQILAVTVTVGLAIVSGLVTGIIMCFVGIPLHKFSPIATYNDALFWKLNDVEEAAEKPVMFELRKDKFVCSTNLLPGEVTNVASANK